jgi:hypothetical protein
MAGANQKLRDARSPQDRGCYELIVRGPDGRPRVERFDDLAAYRARLTTLPQSPGDSVSLEDIVGLLDA